MPPQPSGITSSSPLGSVGASPVGSGCRPRRWPFLRGRSCSGSGRWGSTSGCRSSAVGLGSGRQLVRWSSVAGDRIGSLVDHRIRGIQLEDRAAPEAPEGLIRHSVWGCGRHRGDRGDVRSAAARVRRCTRPRSDRPRRDSSGSRRACFGPRRFPFVVRCRRSRRENTVKGGTKCTFGATHESVPK